MHLDSQLLHLAGLGPSRLGQAIVVRYNFASRAFDPEEASGGAEGANDIKTAILKFIFRTHRNGFEGSYRTS
jgi:hypothetical protein